MSSRTTSTNNFASLENQTSLVTGASTGIGREIALELARAGSDIVVHCRRSIEAAEKVADEIRLIGRSATVISQDLYETAELVAFAEQTWEEQGGFQIAVLNAGVDLLTGAAKDWDYNRKLDALLKIDVTSTAVLGRAWGTRMKEAGNGSLITIGWDQSDRGMEGDSGELFSMAKNSVMGFTRSLALSLAPEVRVNCVSPGWIRTAWGDGASGYWQQRVLNETPLKRWGEPTDIARMIRFLSSEEANFVTGQVINVNGGVVR
ncbi:SDR family NAD(P)-dependent oxidoreductase [Polystyrenella longa]|uniref:SDR family NAD(P)-dependent oxidoreductase n=1 Tax=Polystyrenella longa TaxID=2528007 RepID=UPI0018D21BF5|nr:SDR family oxidoreductase [Polystyrenella longa]